MPFSRPLFAMLPAEVVVAAHRPIRSKPLVLVVDDESTARELLVATLQETPPTWAMNVILARLDVADRHSVAEEHEADAARSRQQLTELVSRAGRVLTPDQQDMASEVQATVKRSAAAVQAWNAARGAGR